MFAIGTVDPLLVDNFSGFDRPQYRSLIKLLDDGTSLQNEIVQEGSAPRGQAQLTGTITSSADVATLRGYYHAATTVPFTDGNGNATDVIVFEFAVQDFTDWWEFTATLIEATVAGS